MNKTIRTDARPEFTTKFNGSLAIERSLNETKFDTELLIIKKGAAARLRVALDNGTFKTKMEHDAYEALWNAQMRTIEAMSLELAALLVATKDTCYKPLQEQIVADEAKEKEMLEKFKEKCNETWKMFKLVEVKPEEQEKNEEPKKENNLKTKIKETLKSKKTKK